MVCSEGGGGGGIMFPRCSKIQCRVSALLLLIVVFRMRTETASLDFKSSDQTAQPHCLLIHLQSSNYLMMKFLSLGVIYLQLVTTDSEDET